MTGNLHSSSAETELSELQPFVYRSQFSDCMEMHGSLDTVAEYLRSHQTWFRRCAHPMQAEAIDPNTYALIIGRFGSLGYEVEPKIALNLLPQDNNVFRICSVPLPDESCTDYTVDFQATMRLVESSNADVSLTHVDWDLNLAVTVRFPRFIYRFPNNMVQGTGDHLLKQIVRQVSRRLTHKVQADFHANCESSPLSS